MSRCVRFIAVLAFWFGASHLALAGDLKLHSLFTSDMVLQRDLPIKIRGHAAAGATVKASLAEQSAAAQADAAGAWLVTLPARPAGGPFELTVEAGAEKVALTGVLVGDVWVCSGQSNMEWPVVRSMNSEAEIAAADHPQLRLFLVKKNSILEPQAEVEGEWKPCSPASVPGFSGVGYFFGRALQAHLNIPIGLIGTYWGGTAAEAWTPKAKLEGDPELAYLADALAEKKRESDQRKVEFERNQKDYQEFFKKWKDVPFKSDADGRVLDPGNQGEGMGWAKPDFDDGAWKPVTQPANLGNTYNMDGAVWYRKMIDIPAAWAGQELTLSLGKIDDYDVTYFNGEKVGAIGKETPEWWQTPRVYKIPAALVKAGRAVIAVRVFDDFSDGGFGGPAAEMKLAPAAGEPLALAGEWRLGVEVAMNVKPLQYRVPVLPTTLYNGMIQPLIEFPIKGAIWYQGESNAGRAYEYRKLMKTMITSWREAWQEPDFPFLIVQLANFTAAPVEPGDSAWAELREAQTMAQELPKVGQALAIDVGVAKDIHPTNKQDVGARLALAAQAIAYGETLVYSGPVYKSMTVEGDKIRLSFDHVAGGLIVGQKEGLEPVKEVPGGELKQFAIAGEDQKFHWAKAVIDGATVVVSCPEVTAPKSVRYAWANNPEGCNLYNREGLPANPFRTDDWPCITKKK